MSVAIKLKDGNTNFGHLHIVSNEDSLSGEDVLMRMQSIINVIKAIDLELINKDDLYFLTCVLEDYLPTPAQANKMFEALPHK